VSARRKRERRAFRSEPAGACFPVAVGLALIRFAVLPTTPAMRWSHAHRFCRRNLPVSVAPKILWPIPRHAKNPRACKLRISERSTVPRAKIESSLRHIPAQNFGETRERLLTAKTPRRGDLLPAQAPPRLLERHP
jgi:hypothetical protein